MLLTGPVVRGDPRRVKLNDLRELAKLLRGPVDDDAYIAYLTRGMAGQKLVADISPSYSLMSTARLAEMAQILPDVRFVFILRDPVQRLWSNVRMMARPKAGAEMAAAAGKILDRAVLGDAPEIEMRSDYCGALQRLGAAVAPKKLKIVFYEDLMTEAGISGLCSFLGLTSLPGDLGRRVHEGAKLAMTGAQKRAAAAWLAPQYDYVNERMGRLPQAWHETLAEAA